MYFEPDYVLCIFSHRLAHLGLLHNYRSTHPHGWILRLPGRSRQYLTFLRHVAHMRSEENLAIKSPRLRKRDKRLLTLFRGILIDANHVATAA